MSPITSVIIKNFILITLIIISLVFVFTANIGFDEIKYIFLILGSLYILFSCIEAVMLSKMISSSVRFSYFTNGFITKRFLKIIFFMCSGVVLFYSHSIIRYMSVLSFIMAFSEILVTTWRYFKDLCFIAFQNDKIIVSTNKQITIPASNISKIAFRHGLTYIVNKQNKAITLRTDTMKEKENFKTELLKWTKQYSLNDKIIYE